MIFRDEQSLEKLNRYKKAKGLVTVLTNEQYGART